MRLNVYLTTLESEALFKMSATEMRLPRDQVRLILRQEMERRGLLVAEEPQPSVQKQLVSSGEAKGRGA